MCGHTSTNPTFRFLFPLEYCAQRFQLDGKVGGQINLSRFITTFTRSCHDTDTHLEDIQFFRFVYFPRSCIPKLTRRSPGMSISPRQTWAESSNDLIIGVSIVTPTICALHCAPLLRKFGDPYSQINHRATHRQRHSPSHGFPPPLTSLQPQPMLQIIFPPHRP